MSATIALDRPSVSPSGGGLLALTRRHPLVAYFVLAYALSWPLVLPILISQRGIGWVNLPEPLLLVFFIGTIFCGPMPAAFVMTGLLEGRGGVRLLVRRMLQWRVGAGWYALVIVGYPVAFLGAASVVHGSAPFSELLERWPLLLSVYLPWIAIGMIFPSLAEEPGWRGFALPRLQRAYGPVLGSLILGVLHALWHTPVYFIPGSITDGGFDLGVFAGNSLEIAAFTFVWTWLFNNTAGSVFFAMFVHAASNANSKLLDQLSSADAGVLDRFLPVLLALLVIAATRGRLAYGGSLSGQPDQGGDRYDKTASTAG